MVPAYYRSPSFGGGTVNKKHIGLIFFSAILLLLTVACVGDGQAASTAKPIHSTAIPIPVPAATGCPLFD